MTDEKTGTKTILSPAFWKLDAGEKNFFFFFTWIARNFGDENISSMACWTWAIVTLDLEAPRFLEAVDLYF